MRVLVTGATGHLGGHVARALRDRGDDVRVLVRDGRDRGDGGGGLPGEPWPGDVLDPDAFARAADGCELVFAVAAPFKLGSRARPGDMVRLGREAARNAVEAAKSAGARRLVVTSCACAVGFGREGLDETRWFLGREPFDAQAVVAAELAGREAAEKHGVDAVFVLPTTVLGPRAPRLTASMRIVLDALHGSGPKVTRDVVSAEDAAAAHLLAAERGRRGERYLVGAGAVDPDGFADVIEALTGRRPSRGLPVGAALRGLATTAWAALRGRPQLVPDPDPQERVEDAIYDTSKARDQLGFAPAPPADAIRAAARWLAFAGPVDEAVARRIREVLPPDPAWPAR